MGGKRVTMRNLTIAKIDPERNVLFLRGSVPGKPGTFIRIHDGRSNKFNSDYHPPFPTYIEGEHDAPEVLIAPVSDKDPLNFRLAE